MKSLKTYAYQTENSAVFPNGQTDKNVNYVFMDGKRKRLCYKNNQHLLLLTEKWAYKADHRSKSVSVFNVVRYNDLYKASLPELNTVFESNAAISFLDSVVVKKGKLVEAKRVGDISTFKLRFPADFYVEEMIIVFDNKKQLPQSIYTRSFYSGDQAGTRSKGTVYTTNSSNYSLTVPDSEFDTNTYFKVSGGKVQLSKYKNYKVSSIL